jgi:flagellar M-ring protein FliF
LSARRTDAEAASVNEFLQQLSRIGPARLIVMFGVAAGVAGALMVVSMGIGGANRQLLYSGLEMTEATAMAQRLDQSGVGYEFSAGGTALLVDTDQVLEARMMLSSEGLPSSGSVGYEIFDRQDGFGATQFVQNVNRVRALEGELARTIRSLDGVAAARVHLALPERRLFDRAAEQPKASVWIALRQGDLAARHARAIRNLVAGAVPGLSGSAVTILDEEGRLLARGDGGEEDGAYSMALEERRAEIEDRMRRRVVDLIESVVGRGAVEVQVSAEINRERITESSELYDPSGQVVRSTSTIEESSNESDRERDGAVSASAAIPDGADTEAEGRTTQAAAVRTEETTNFEISRTTRTQVREGGEVQRISVAVVVDGVTSVDDAGETTWEPRTAEELERIAALTRTAIGFNEQRGDAVEVANVRFARTPVPDAATGAPSPFQLDKNDLMRGAELLVLTIVAAMIIFLVARPLLKSIPASAPGVLAIAGAPAAGASQATITEAETLSLTGGKSEDAPKVKQSLPPPEDERINVAQIEGQVRASSVRKVAEIVEAHPEDSVAILRTWLHGG